MFWVPVHMRTYVHPPRVKSLFPSSCGAPALKPHWPSKLNALGVLPSDARPSDYLGGLCYVGISLCSLHGFNFLFFLVLGLFLDCHFFPQCMVAIITLIGGLTGVVMTRACPGY